MIRPPHDSLPVIGLGVAAFHTPKMGPSQHSPLISLGIRLYALDTAAPLVLWDLKVDNKGQEVVVELLTCRIVGLGYMGYLAAMSKLFSRKGRTGVEDVSI